MNVSDFSNEKLFVLIKTWADANAFTSNPLGTNEYRTAANNSGVLVFIEPLKKIYARGSYYGIGSEEWQEYANKVDALNTAVTEMLGSLASLQSAVATNTTNIGHLPYEYEDEETHETIQVPGAGLINDVAELTGRVTELENAIEDLSPEGKTLVEMIEDTVTEKMGDYVTLEDFNNALADKADKAEFDSFVTEVTSTLETLEGNVSTNTEAINSLTQIVSGIPKFGIKIVPSLPSAKIPDGQGGEKWNIYDENTNPDGISLTTIYLVKRDAQSDQAQDEVFTEYIFVEQTGQNNVNTYAWEKLGSQFFQINNYYTIDEMNDAIKDAIEEAVGDALTDPDIEEGSNWYAALKAQIKENADNIETNAGNITDNANAITALQNLLYTIDENQNKIWKFTGEDILTHPNGESTIAQDIDSLYGKIQWQIIEN